MHVASLLRLGLSPRCPVLPHPLPHGLALFLRHRALPLGDHLERLLLAAPGGRRGICSLNSIAFSFLPDVDRQRLLRGLEDDFAAFEAIPWELWSP